MLSEASRVLASQKKGVEMVYTIKIKKTSGSTAVIYDTAAPPELDSKQLGVLANEVGQFFNSFVLYGFDSQGRPIKLGQLSSPMEQLAMEQFVMEDMSSTPSIVSPHDDDDDDEDWYRRPLIPGSTGGSWATVAGREFVAHITFLFYKYCTFHCTFLCQKLEH